MIGVETCPFSLRPTLNQGAASVPITVVAKIARLEAAFIALAIGDRVKVAELIEQMEQEPAQELDRRVEVLSPHAMCGRCFEAATDDGIIQHAIGC